MARFGVSRLAHEYDQVTQSFTAAASDMGKSLDDLKEHASRFSKAFSITRRSEAVESSKRLGLNDLLAKKQGIVSFHEAFASMQGSERMRFVSAAQWLSQLRSSREFLLEGNFITLRGFQDAMSHTLSLLKECGSRGASLIVISSTLGFDMLVAKEAIGRLVSSGHACVDESIGGVRYFINLFS